MHLTLKERRQLFLLVMALTIAAAANRGRAKPRAIAHRAYEFARASIAELAVRARVQKAARRGSKRA
jgi:hypothetical protein